MQNRADELAQEANEVNSRLSIITRLSNPLCNYTVGISNMAMQEMKRGKGSRRFI
jgi:hypothetical protein